MKNIDLFNYSIAKSNNDFDFDFTSELIVLPKNKYELNELTIKNNELIELISAYKIIKNVTDNNNLKEQIIFKIIDILDNTKLINYSPFCAYFQVLGYSYSLYKRIKDDQLDVKKNIIIKIVEQYLINRHELYLNHGYSNITLQTAADLSLSRRKGERGINQISKQLLSLNFKKVNTFIDLENNNLAFFNPDRENRILFEETIKKLNFKYDFSNIKDAKLPDSFIKINNNYFIVEHKLIKDSGGSQNMSINELILLIKEKTNSNQLHFISLLDSDYWFNKLKFNELDHKIFAQYENIIFNLKENPNNYFVSPKGFEKLIKNFLKN
ncbi:hypothetical protein [Mycoplasmopsis gallinarum]|uniref:Restriction endonuclease n=1 Tax=Mycoplasmopsis gallinarum TaxID=29557 RepID=A0A168RJ53_9BACT|nr:hypothetical protein [Mycoplasmopsis gallinarum]OAB49033.1 hypothetical protein MGALLINA_02020 [Mycoplasmopsis gallinarum]